MSNGLALRSSALAEALTGKNASGLGAAPLHVQPLFPGLS